MCVCVVCWSWSAGVSVSMCTFSQSPNHHTWVVGEWNYSSQPNECKCKAFASSLSEFHLNNNVVPCAPCQEPPIEEKGRVHAREEKKFRNRLHRQFTSCHRFDPFACSYIAHDFPSKWTHIQPHVSSWSYDLSSPTNFKIPPPPPQQNKIQT